jgi:ATP-binding cassette subfamily B protein
MILMSLMMVSMVYVMIIIGRNSTERILEAIEEVPDIADPENPIETVPNGEVEFRHVNFAYSEGKDVLLDVNRKVKSGSTIGILGPTGSSKTTLISLIARLFDVQKGEVLVGGHNVKEYKLESLRDSVAVVLQKNTLFTGTIRDNLKWGNENATDEEIMAACDIAQVTPFLKDMPQGLDTMIEQGGTNVSGGQKQRLCIARALLKNPKILILDDSTSACDTHTDKLIREGLEKYHPDITKFIIAQRVLSVKDCSEIWVMNEGEVLETGTNDELMKTSAVYRDLFESQNGGGDFDAAS